MKIKLVKKGFFDEYYALGRKSILCAKWVERELKLQTKKLPEEITVHLRKSKAKGFKRSDGVNETGHIYEQYRRHQAPRMAWPDAVRLLRTLGLENGFWYKITKGRARSNKKKL
jgi:hypothetical protein